LGAQLTWYVVTNADVLIVGRLLGQSTVGVYALTLAIATAPLQKITSLVARVAFPIFSRVQADHETLKRYLLAITEGLSLICFPLAIGLALEASKFVPVVLGEKWNEAVVPMQLLSVLTAMRAIAPLIPQVLNVIGGVRFSMYNGVLAAIVAPVAFYVGAEKAGLAGVAAGWIITIVLTSPPVYWAVMKRTGLSVHRYLKSLWPAVSACCVMTLSVLGLRWFLSGTNVEPVWQLLFEIAAGALAYLGTVLALHRDRLVTFLSVIRRGQADSPPQPAGSPVQVAVEDTNR
jgi:O-antigen/teichoic acid export membrane protein